MIVAGFGFRSGATCASLRSALGRAVSAQVVTALAAPCDKMDAASLCELAAETGLPIVAVSPADLSGAATLTMSEASRAHRDTGSVAEAAALVAAGPGARLISPRHVSQDRRATCALAIRETP